MDPYTVNARIHCATRNATSMHACMILNDETVNRKGRKEGNLPTRKHGNPCMEMFEYSIPYGTQHEYSY